MSEICTCWKCGRSGFVMDEFTSPHTGLCAACTESKLPAPDVNLAETEIETEGLTQ